MADAVIVAVIGASGQVGQATMQLAPIHGLQAVPLARNSASPGMRADLLDHESIRRALTAVRPTHVVLAAGATSVVQCEEDPVATRLANVSGTRAVAECAARLGAPLVFFSTDYVFDGEAGPYDPDAPTHPINEYGRQKLDGEHIVLDAGPNLVVRTCQVFGRDHRRKNYVLRIVDELRGGGVVQAALDLRGTPTYAPDLAIGALKLLLLGAEGIRHVAGDRYLSRFELAQKVATAFGIDPNRIEGVLARDDGVPRPRMSGLISGVPSTPLEAALRQLESWDATSRAAG